MSAVKAALACPSLRLTTWSGVPLQIDVTPSQPEQLTSPYPGNCRGSHERIESMILSRGEEGRQLVAVSDVGFGANADAARRAITHHFLATWRLCEAGYLSKVDTRTATRDQSGI